MHLHDNMLHQVDLAIVFFMLNRLNTYAKTKKALFFLIFCQIADFTFVAVMQIIFV